MQHLSLQLLGESRDMNSFLLLDRRKRHNLGPTRYATFPFSETAAAAHLHSDVEAKGADKKFFQNETLFRLGRRNQTYFGGFGLKVLLHAIWCTTRLTPTDRRNARIWRIYLDEGAKMDTETLTGVHNTTDVLLALYCVVQTSQNIQADYNQVSTPVLCKSSRYSALFFSGLAIFLFPLGIKVAWLVSITRVMAYAAYFFAPIIPLIHPYFLHQSPSYHGFIRVDHFTDRGINSGADYNTSCLRSSPLRDVERGYIQKTLPWLYSIASVCQCPAIISGNFFKHRGMSPSDRVAIFGTYGLTRESTADLCSNPQLKLLPCAYAQSQRVLYASPRRLHSDTNIVVTAMSSRSSCDQRGPGDLGLEFFVGSLTLNEDGMVTAIDKPTDGMRKHLRDIFGQMGLVEASLTVIEWLGLIIRRLDDRHVGPDTSLSVRQVLFVRSNMLVRFPAMRDWWYKAVVHPLQWNRSEEFFAWAFLERVEVAVMIGELLASMGNVYVNPESDLLRVTTEQQTYLAKASNDTPVERGIQNFGDPSCLLPLVKDGTDFTASNCGHLSAIDVTLIEEGVNFCKEPCKPCPIIN
ncbi:hypothetical protein EV421DRAFT_1743303 [Armillaria borealis]|uniref:Uncharacterized protein n=1 Tax=Armillaria borealis TaxID=47425 RepID=A0AA39IYL7_9AGAR|nr:hypothetical protein EV421DRAFT_1743303 [Armillaria borealis]